jgi:8-amino-7-oxononanoate synthase
MQLSDYLLQELDILKAKNLFRDLDGIAALSVDKSIVDFSSNDYLGLAGRGLELLAKHAQYDLNDLFTGSAGSRLISGTHPVHTRLEAEIAQWKKTEAAIFFGSGYLANLGTISALFNMRDVIFSDELNHSCILDGIRLSGAKKFIYKHGDTRHLQELLDLHRNKYSKAVITTDSVFSMDGDKAPLVEIVKLAKQYQSSVYIDEAHASGVLGSNGAGLYEELCEQNLLKAGDIDIQMGTFSKALGLEGAYVAGSKDLINYLRNKARTFVYSTAPSPLIAAMALANLMEVRHNKALRQKLSDNIQYFKHKLSEAQGDLLWTNDDTAIFAVQAGSLENMQAIIAKLAKEKIKLMMIKPPTVGSSRLRVCISAEQQPEQMDMLIKFLVSIPMKSDSLRTCLESPITALRSPSACSFTTPE